MKHFFIPKTFFTFLLAVNFCFFKPPCLHADSEAPNFPNVQVSPDGLYYSKSVPAEVSGTRGQTKVFRVSLKKDVFINKFDWYSPKIFLQTAQDGFYLARPGPWARGQEASADDWAIEFYKNDRFLRSYSTLDLAGVSGNIRNISRSISHYTVIKEYKGFSYDGEMTVFGITLEDGREMNFNADTGEIIPPRDVFHRDELITGNQPDLQVDRYAQKVTVGNNQLLAMKVVKQTQSGLDVEIEYNYEPQGEDWANLSAGILRKEGYLPFIGFCPAQLTPGHHKAVISMNLTPDAPDSFTSDEVEITMYRKRGYEFLSDLAKRFFPYEKVWAKAAAPATKEEVSSWSDIFLAKVEKILPSSWKSSLRLHGFLPDIPESQADRGKGVGYGRIGQVTVIKDTNDTLELEIHYVYDPQQSRFAELSAATFLGNGSPNHDKRFPFRVKPGFSTAVLKIERSPMAPTRYETDRIRVVLVGNYLTDDPNNRLFVGETFVYPKTWSQSPIEGSAKNSTGQVLVREGEGK